MSYSNLQLKRGTSVQNDGYTGLSGELTVDTDKRSLRLHDGAKAGGVVVGGSSEIAVGNTCMINSEAESLTIDGKVYLRSGVMVSLDDYPNYPLNLTTLAPFNTPKLGELPATSMFHSLAFGNGFFLAGGQYHTKWAKSTFGDVWTEGGAVSVIGIYESIFFGGGKFVAIARQSNVSMTTEDGVNYQTGTPFGDQPYNTRIAYGNGLYVAVTTTGWIMTSEDGLAWTRRTYGTEFALYSITYGNGKFLAIGNSLKVLVSNDGVSWVTREAPDIGYRYITQYGGGSFVILPQGGTKALHSNDTINWTIHDLPYNFYAYGATYGGGAFKAINLVEDNYILSSIDGKTWTAEPHGGLKAARLDAIAYGNGVYAMVGYFMSKSIAKPITTVYLGLPEYKPNLYIRMQ